MVNKLPEGALTSGLSLAENVLRISYMCEQETEDRELKEPKYYLDKFYEIAEDLKKEINDGKDAEEIIRKFTADKIENMADEQEDMVLLEKRDNYAEEYKTKHGKLTEDVKKEIIQKVVTEWKNDEYLKDILNNIENIANNVSSSYLTKFLDSGKINCVGSASLFLSLAEMLDFGLYEKCYLGDLPNHSIIRLKLGEGYKNVDYGKVRSDECYLDKFGEFPKTLPKKALLADLLGNLSKTLSAEATDLVAQKRSINKEYYDGLLTAEKLYKSALKGYNRALNIIPHYDAKYNKNIVDKQLDLVHRLMKICERTIKGAQSNHYNPLKYNSDYRDNSKPWGLESYLPKQPNDYENLFNKIELDYCDSYLK